MSTTNTPPAPDMSELHMTAMRLHALLAGLCILHDDPSRDASAAVGAMAELARDTALSLSEEIERAS